MRATAAAASRNEPRRTGPLVAVGFLTLLVASVATATNLLPIVAFAGLVGVDATLVLWSTRITRAGGFGPDVQGRALAIAWLVVVLIGVHNFSHRASSQAVTQASLQTALEIVVYGAIGALSVAVLRAHRADPVLPVWLLLLPVWVTASSTWSDYGLFAFVRGMQYFVLLAMAAATISLGLRSLADLESLVWTLLRNYVWTIAGLIVLGFLLGPLFVLFDETNRGRFTWMGAHPGGSGQLMGASLIVLLASPLERLRLTPLLRLALLGELVFALYKNQTRTVLGGIPIVLVILCLRWARSRPNGITGSLYLAGGTTLGVVFGGGAIMNYILRGDSISKLWSFNGRSELWPIGLAHLDSIGKWLGGLGYGASRTIFVESHRWAGSAHSSALGNLVNLGVIGLGITLAVIGSAALALRRRHAMRTTSYGTVLVCLLVFIVAAGAASENLAEPTFGTGVLYLVAAIAHVVASPRWDEDQEPPTPTLSRSAASR